MKDYEVDVDIKLDVVVKVQTDDLASALTKAKDKAKKQIHAIKQIDLNDWTLRPRGIFNSDEDEPLA